MEINTYKVNIPDIKPNMCIIMRILGPQESEALNRPCLVISTKVSMSGKHGAQKTHVIGRDIFTSTVYEMVYRTNDESVDAIVPVRYEAYLDSVSDDGTTCTVINDGGVFKRSIKVPEIFKGPITHKIDSGHKKKITFKSYLDTCDVMIDCVVILL